MSVLRRFAVTAAGPARSFHSSARALIRVGDKLPQLNEVLVESSPGNKVAVSELSSGKALIIGVPAAFSKSRITLLKTRGYFLGFRSQVRGRYEI